MGICFVPVLIDDINNEFNVPQKKKLENLNYRLGADYIKYNKPMPVHGLIGVNLIQFMGSLHMINCDGIIPFGDIINFLYPTFGSPFYMG